jgi:hypothetical protein
VLADEIDIPGSIDGEDSDCAILETYLAVLAALAGRIHYFMIFNANPGIIVDGFGGQHPPVLLRVNYFLTVVP